MNALLNLRQTAEMLNLAEVTIRKLVRSGKLPAIRIGRRLLFEPDKLAEFVASHRTPTAAKTTRLSSLSLESRTLSKIRAQTIRLFESEKKIWDQTVAGND